jgi:hypothetical protein
LPKGFVLDNAEAPGSFTGGQVCKYDVDLSVSSANTLVYKRKFNFGEILFPTSAYQSLKQVFDELHKRDNHVIALRQ